MGVRPEDALARLEADQSRTNQRSHADVFRKANSVRVRQPLPLKRATSEAEFYNGTECDHVQWHPRRVKQPCECYLAQQQVGYVVFIDVKRYRSEALSFVIVDDEGHSGMKL